MKMYKLAVVTLFFLLALYEPVKAQKIEYSFGEESDVIDSIRAAVSWFKKNYNSEKVNLYVGLDMCEGNLNIYISQYLNKKGDGVTELAKSTNRIIRLSDRLRLPVLFSTDVLSAQMIKEKVEFIHMGGYYLRVGKNEKHIWKVVSTSITF